MDKKKVLVRILPVEELSERWRKAYDNNFIYGISRVEYQKYAGHTYEVSIDDCSHSACISCIGSNTGIYLYFPKGTYTIIKRSFNSLLQTEGR